MNRRDAHLDAVLRHLGAAYYDSLHGKAAPADVARALDSVAGQVGEEPTGQLAAAGCPGGSSPTCPATESRARATSAGAALPCNES